MNVCHEKGYTWPERTRDVVETSKNPPPCLRGDYRRSSSDKQEVPV